MNLQQTFSKILGREITEDEARDLASTQFGMLADYLRRNSPTRETESPIETDYTLIPLFEIEDEARKIAVAWCEGFEEWMNNDLPSKHKLASDIMNYAKTNPELLKLKSIFDLADFHEFQNASEKLFLTEKLKANNFNIQRTAEEIGIQRSHAYNLIDKYDIEIKREH